MTTFGPAPLLSATFIVPDYGMPMRIDDLDGPAELIRSIHRPCEATLGECLRHWSALDPPAQSQSYLVLRGEAGLRRTYAGEAIGELAARLG